MHQDEGHYAAKHPKGENPETAAAEAVKKRSNNGRISCTSAHEAAAETGAEPGDIGKTLDLLEIRINGCQLGLFGHGGKDHGKAELKLGENAVQLKAFVSRKSGENGISCYDLWTAAEEFGCSKREAAAACDELGISIHSCQLGAF